MAISNIEDQLHEGVPSKCRDFGKQEIHSRVTSLNYLPKLNCYPGRRLKTHTPLAHQVRSGGKSSYNRTPEEGVSAPFFYLRGPARDAG